MNDQELKRLLDSFETPPADLAGPVLARLRAAKRKRRFSRFYVLAAALAAAAALLGAQQFYSYIMIGADGSIEEAQVAASEEAPAGEADDSLWPDFQPEPQSPLEYYLMVTDRVNGCSPPRTEENLPPAELWEMVSGSSLKLPFPASYPEGFRILHCGAFLYLTPDMADLPEAGWIDGGNGFHFQKFILPESVLYHPGWYSIVLADGDRRIDFDVMLTGAEDRTLAAGGSKSERIKVAGQKAVYVEEPPGEFSPQGRKTVFFTGKIRETPYIQGFDLGRKELKERGIEPLGDIRVYNYRYYACTISAEGVDRETLLEFADGIAFPGPGDTPPDVPAVTLEPGTSGGPDMEPGAYGGPDIQFRF